MDVAGRLEYMDGSERLPQDDEGNEAVRQVVQFAACGNCGLLCLLMPYRCQEEAATSCENTTSPLASGVVVPECQVKTCQV